MRDDLDAFKMRTRALFANLWNPRRRDGIQVAGHLADHCRRCRLRETDFSAKGFRFPRKIHQGHGRK
jgi:hypothetical protein